MFLHQCLSGDKQIIVDPLAFSEERFRPSLEERLESIISGAALMADSSCTRDDRRERIVAECNSEGQLYIFSQQHNCFQLRSHKKS
ncbi:Catenin alpha-1 [Liparis tanakae]|uniref:Catenin alpha-1 n=1 Tax=Liparis tanakae TaxID=230148 RepID=A0A4Z2GVG3_9TELE|nr:Catenin alpha-1 [Liparis tanakae]